MKEEVKNLFAPTAVPAGEELLEVMLRTPGFRIERIISRGHSSPPGFFYEQEENEWVILLKGKAGLLFADQQEVVLLNPGDYLHIDKGRRHRVAWTDPGEDTIWLAVHYP